MAEYTLPTTEARRRFLSLVKDAGDSFARYVITHRGRPEAVMMSIEEFEGWRETLEMAQSPSWRRAMEQAAREERAAKRLTFESATGVKQKRSRAR